MTKSQVIETLAKAEGITLKAAETVVELAIETMAVALVNGDRVEIRGLGTFKIKHYDGFDGRNPKTFEKIEVKPKRLPFYKMGRELKRRLI